MATAAATKYKVHPVAALFPMMSSAEIEAMARDIAEHGQAHPIVVRNGVLLDGRNRLAACEWAGEEPIIEEWRPRHSGDTPESYIISVNLPRRHLTESQRAMLASDFGDYLRKQRQSTETTDKQEDGGGKFAPEGRTADAASVAFNVSATAVKQADKVKRDGAPALVKAVREGKAKVSAAAKATKAPKDEQARAAAQGKRGVTALAKKAATPADPPTVPTVEDLSAGEQQKRWRKVAEAVVALDRALAGAYIVRDKGDLAPESDVEQIVRIGRPVVKDVLIFDSVARRVSQAMGQVERATGKVYGGRK